MGSFYSMNAFEPLVWMLLLFCIVRILRGGNSRLWLLVGVLAGLGLELKHTSVVYLAALLIAILLTPARRLLWNRWAATAVVVCAVLVLPNAAWQVRHGFPSLEFYRNATINKNIPTPPLAVVASQVLFTNPGLLPLWLAGLAWLVASERGKPYRFLAFAYALLLAAMIGPIEPPSPDRGHLRGALRSRRGSPDVGAIVSPAPWTGRFVRGVSARLRHLARAGLHARAPTAHPWTVSARGRAVVESRGG